MRIKETKKESTVFICMRLLGSALMIGLPASAMIFVAFTEHLSFISLFLIYVVYSTLVALLLCMIAGRLYKLHGTSEPRIDLATMLLVTTLIVLPLGFSDLFSFTLRSLSVDDFKVNASQVTVYIAIGLYLLILPIFFVTEITLGRLQQPGDKA